MSIKDYHNVRVMRLCDGWLEADWVEDNGKNIVYRVPDHIGLSKVGIIVAHRVDTGYTHATTIRFSGFSDAVSRSAVNRALKQLEDNEYIYKSAAYRGTNSRWRSYKKIGVIGKR